MDLAKVLGRRERDILPAVQEAMRTYRGKVVLITGAKGSIGSLLAQVFEYYGITAFSTDVEDMDVTSVPQVEGLIGDLKPDCIFNFAGAKHAPAGEEEPFSTFYINTFGAQNVLYAGRNVGAKVILASTCKACNPETSYGASKLIAERMVLNAGGSVARFYNVVETSGNVFEIWDAIPESEPIPVTDCKRFFISVREAVWLSVITGAYPSGRYVLDPGFIRDMKSVAYDLYPERTLQYIPARRGDRLEEPRIANQERLVETQYPYIEQVISNHDQT